MNFEEWESLYEEIIRDFGYSREKDRDAAERLQDIGKCEGLNPLKDLRDQRVGILGPCLQSEKLPATDRQIAAGSALTNSVGIGIEPDLLVTDLDGDAALQVKKNNEGLLAVVHAHGDNIKAMERWVPELSGEVICTCQCEPLDGVYNFGGFTDGDRAAFIADHFGAEKIVLIGWDFENPRFKETEEEIEIKKKKLRWAKRLIGLIHTPVEY